MRTSARVPVPLHVALPFLAVAAAIQACQPLQPPIAKCIVDGTLDTSFTNAAAEYTFTANVPAGGTSPAAVWLLAADPDLCVAVRVNSAGQLASSEAQFTFTAPPRGSAVATGDDRLEVNRSGTTTTFVDGFWIALTGGATPGVDVDDGGTSDGVGAVGGVGGTYVAELSHPLNSADDAHDFSLAEGDSICLTLVLNLTDSAGNFAQTIESFPCYEVPRAFSPCEAFPGGCVAPELEPNRILLYCVEGIQDCHVVDWLPQNCLLKWGGQCPGCPAGARYCPGPRYRITLTGLNDREWSVDLLNAAGERVPHDRSRTEAGLEISFTPGPGEGLAGGIADYALVFTMQPGGEPGRRYEIGALLDHGPLPER